MAGEALIDLVIDPTGAVSAWPGGAPFNVARAVARLGGEAVLRVDYIGKIFR